MVARDAAAGAMHAPPAFRRRCARRGAGAGAHAPTGFRRRCAR